MLSSNALLTIWKSSVCRLNTINFVPYSDGHNNLRIEGSMHVMPKCYSVGAAGLEKPFYAELIKSYTLKQLQ